ncbi:MAG: hypothetical protein WKF90_04660 [Pyrinomonadaceae bacterium]
MKKLILLLLVVVIGAVVLADWGLRKTETTAEAAVETTQQTKVAVERANTIDGATNPELIPDSVAYSLLFDLIAKRETEKEKRRIKAYIKEVGLSGADVDVLIASAKDFRERVSTLDTQAARINIRTRTNPPPVLTQSQVSQLRQLETQRNLIVESVAAILRNRLSGSGSEKLRRHVNERVKRKTKIFSNETGGSQ